MGLNLVISILAACASVALFVFGILKPALRKKMLETPGVVRPVLMDSESKALLMTVPFTWYCKEDDFVAYASKEKLKDPRIELVGHFTEHGNYVVACQWVENAMHETKYDLSKMNSKYCQVAFKTCAIVDAPDPVAEAERLLMAGVRSDNQE